MGWHVQNPKCREKHRNNQRQRKYGVPPRDFGRIGTAEKLPDVGCHNRNRQQCDDLDRLHEQSKQCDYDNRKTNTEDSLNGATDSKHYDTSGEDRIVGKHRVHAFTLIASFSLAVDSAPERGSLCVL